MRVAVVGSRSFTDYALLKKTLSTVDVSTIVSGGAHGADALAERYAEENDLETSLHFPDWKKFGRGAGMIRNKDIILDAELVIAFWDGASPGTANTIKQCEKLNKTIKVVIYNESE